MTLHLWFCRLAWTLLALMAVCTFPVYGSREVHVRQQQKQACDVQLRFQEYVPSTWETFWLTHGQELQHRVCETLLEDESKVQKWLETVQQYSAEGAVDKIHWDPTVFSKYVYTNQCQPHNPPIEVFIEPAVGVLRHPYGACTKTVHVEERSYIVLSGMSGNRLNAVYPGRKYLFDLGTRTYDTSLDWLVKAYQAVGVEFDEMFAWELEAYDPAVYWQGVTPAVVGKLHFYNVPVDKNLTKPSHPLNMIKTLHRPGDLIIVKLDIDNSNLEAFILDRFQTDPELAAAVSDLFVELHHNNPVMHQWGWQDFTAKLPEVLEQVSSLRSLGMRVHPWP